MDNNDRQRKYNPPAPPQEKKLKILRTKKFIATPIHTSRFLPYTSQRTKKREECNHPADIKHFKLFN